MNSHELGEEISEVPQFEHICHSHHAIHGLIAPHECYPGHHVQAS